MKLSLQLSLPTSTRGYKEMAAECGLRPCRNTRIVRGVRSRPGVTLGEKWYCSPECFAAAAGAKIASMSTATLLEMPPAPRLSIGLVLISKGHLTEAQLRSAMQQGRLHGEELDATLLRLGMATERQLTSARAAQWGYPMLGQELRGRPVEVDLPGRLLDHCGAVPLHYVPAARQLLMGFTHRVDHTLLTSIQTMTGLRADACFVTPAELAEQRDRVGAMTPRVEQVAFDDVLPSARIGRILGGFALEAGARDAIFSRCRDYVWVRLLGRVHSMDAVFRIRAQAAQTSELKNRRELRAMN
jgi:hypothetical protein